MVKWGDLDAEVRFTLVCTSCCAGWPDREENHGSCKRCGGDLELRGVVRIYDLKGDACSSSE